MEQKDIFNLIKNKNFNKLKEIIKKDAFNPNIKDNINNYIIHYILNFNELELLKILTNKNIKLDILDTDGRNILYIPIKYNYLEALKIIIDKDKKSIGVPIYDKKDKLGLNGLHYCCILNNIEVFKYLIDIGADPTTTDKTGKNSFQVAMEYNRKEILKILLDKFNNLDYKNKKGESLLHLSLTHDNNEITTELLKKNINVNTQDNEFGITPLQLTIILNKNVFAKKIIEKGGNINLSDFIGNTNLHYSIIENNYEMMDILIEKNINYNTINIDGKTCLHLFLEMNIVNNNRERYEETKQYKILLKLIKNTDLNIQDNEGNTGFHYLVEKYFIEDEEIINILQKKELNLFIENNNNNNVLSLSNNKKDLIDIVSKGYYNILLNDKENKHLEKWEKECSSGNKKDYCINKIKTIIEKEKRSISKHKVLDLKIDNGIAIDSCFYTGSAIDILFGLTYLFEKHSNVKIPISYPLTINKKLEEYYEKNGMDYAHKLDFSNIEINWVLQKLIFPTSFDTIMKDLSKDIKYVVIPLGIELSKGAHANIIFYDVKNNLVERFEPNGANYPRDFNYNPNLLDELLKNKFKKINPKINYKSPKDYLPTVGLQLLETFEDNKCKKIGDPNGFCAIWCTWWINQKLKNPNIPSEELIKILIKTIKLQNKTFKSVIRNFSKKITELRDNYLEKYKIDINDWITNNYEQDILDKLEKDIIELFD